MTAFTVPAGQLAPAVHYTARWLHAKPVVPAYGGILFEVVESALAISGFGENVTARAFLDLDSFEFGHEDAFVLSGRLLDGLVGTFPTKPVTFEREGSAVVVTCGSWRGTLPVMSANDYPPLPGTCTLAGHVDGDDLADAVQRVAVAASRDLTKEIPLAGLHIEFTEYERDGDPPVLTLTCTDRYRGARYALPWSPGHDAAPIGESSLPYAAVLNDAVDAFTGGEVAVGWEGHALSLATPTRSLVMRVMGKQEMNGFPAAGMQAMCFRPTLASARLRVADLAQPLKTAKQLVNREFERVRLTFRHDTLIVTAAQDEVGQGDEEIAISYEGEDTQMLVKLPLFQSALSTAPGDVVDLAFDPGGFKPAIITAPADPAWRFIVSPLREMR